MTPPPLERSRTSSWIFGASILGSAFLIFLIQPMVAKRILPWFGGVPAVWMICLAFYQTTLFVGYAYAHALVRFVPSSGQAVIHAVLLLGAFALLPILPTRGWEAAEIEDPLWRIVTLLFSQIALPFLALSATGPLVQAWFARRWPDQSPYALYALSNAGSLFALLAFPFLLEPRFALTAVGGAWDSAFIVVGLGVATCGFLARGLRPVASPGASEAATRVEAEVEVNGRSVLIWVLYSATAVVLMMGVSNRLCLDVASVPFLWILPLGTYLITLILCFSSERMYSRSVWVVGSVVSLVIGLVTKIPISSMNTSVWTVLESVQFQVPFYTFLLFSFCMVLHGELYRWRPAPQRLTLFYLSTSGGGALGGLFVGLAAPFLFYDYHELEFGILLLLPCIAAAMIGAQPAPGQSDDGVIHPPRVRGGRFAALAAVLLIAGYAALSFAPKGRTIWQERSFFGVMRVTERGEGKSASRALVHGSTLHGVQFIDEKGRKIPTSYYGAATAIRGLFTSRSRESPIRVGVIGLGVGTIAAYGQDGDLFRFYEIDPAVGWVAGQDGHFHYLRESRAQVETRFGDARIALENAISRSERLAFDILILDAFSSDSIPTHLMTRESFELYRDTLAEGGVIAVHCTNRFLSLMPVVSRLGWEIGLPSVQIESMRAPRFQSKGASWVFLSADVPALRAVVAAARGFNRQKGLPQNRLQVSWPSEADLGDVSLWTDDHTDLFGALRAVSWDDVTR